MTVTTDPQTRQPSRLRLVLAAAATVLIAALVVAAVVLGYMYMQDREVEHARTDAVRAASTQAVAMLGYDFGNVDKELPKAVDGLTGDFRDQYTKLIQEAIIPGAKEKQLTVKVSVEGASVVSATKSDVVVLMFLNQVTTGKDSPKAVTSGSRIRMNMHKEHGRWLVSELVPI